MVAATNWPPKVVKPLYGAERLTLLYEGQIPIDAAVSYECMIVDVEGDSARGDVPWQLALDRYRAWLDSHVPAPAYPDWMWEGQGFLDIQLGLRPLYDIRSIQKLYQNHKHLYPWVLFWGQMVAPGSKICCALSREMHDAYLETLPDFVRKVAVQGGRAGYYSAPYYGLDGQNARRNLDTPEGRDWLLTWLQKNTAYGANAYYIDTVGRSYYGDPARVMDLFESGSIPSIIVDQFIPRTEQWAQGITKGGEAARQARQAFEQHNATVRDWGFVLKAAGVNADLLAVSEQKLTAEVERQIAAMGPLEQAQARARRSGGAVPAAPASPSGQRAPSSIQRLKSASRSAGHLLSQGMFPDSSCA